MAIMLDEQVEQYLIGSIRRFYTEELEDDIGDLKARLVLDFFVGELGPSVYNQAILDAQATMTIAVADIAGNRHEPEFDYWRRR